MGKKNQTIKNMARHVVASGVFITGVFIYEIFNIKAALNLTIFFSYVVFALFIFTYVMTSLDDEDCKKIKNKLLQTYKDGKHLPKRLDSVLYFSIICTMDSYGSFMGLHNGNRFFIQVTS